MMSCGCAERKRKIAAVYVSVKKEVKEMAKRMTATKADMLEEQLKIERQAQRVDSERAKLMQMKAAYKAKVGKK